MYNSKFYRCFLLEKLQHKSCFFQKACSWENSSYLFESAGFYYFFSNYTTGQQEVITKQFCIGETTLLVTEKK